MPSAAAVFDGIDRVVIPTADLRTQLDVFVLGLGFLLIREEPLTDPVWAEVWGLPAPPTRSVLLGRPGSRGGWVRLVEAPGLPAPEPAGRPDRPGCYALDFYLRDPDATESRLAALGLGFRSAPVHYLLPGTAKPVRERMLDNVGAGLLHALVAYRPRVTRCVLDVDPDLAVSEVVAMVFATTDLVGAHDLATDVLRGQCYLDGRFEGPAVEDLLGLEPGEGFRATLFRGPTSRNARLEFVEALAPTRTSDPVPRAVASLDVPDLGVVVERLADGRHGRLGPVVTASIDGVSARRVGLATRYGAHLELVEAVRTPGR